ncbi:hypothetical protein HOP50_05g38500 [Chloropicon primus]|uniref:Uncharacterized protein n=1 Tax=Chloropicon primus TaxID=1764295 RepID=A0A5B8MLL6_9CHLO|nr:hypothetical protein A3770_05p38370 [Chloropicon primus]UPR00535.1 hypothetical protein HOP50_05g38500 [Chloropicon primus]|eukprot:QDZ21319.1 hypothetical protein A3770_05p38370 [Chloropicon primus]
MLSEGSRTMTVKALEAKPPGTPYLDANSSGPSSRVRPGEAMRVASFVSEMSKRATSNAPVFDGGTGSEGAWVPPQKEGVSSLRMGNVMRQKEKDATSENSVLDRSQAFAYGSRKSIHSLAPIKGLVGKNRAGGTEENKRGNVANFAAGLRHRQQRKSLMGGQDSLGLLGDLNTLLDSNSKFLIAQLMELGVRDNAAVRGMLEIEERKGLMTPRWALDHIHSAIEIFAHGFHNLVEELIKLAMTQSKEDKVEMLDLSNPSGDTFGEAGTSSGQNLNEADVEEYGATLLLKCWALLLGYAENLTLSSDQLLSVTKSEDDDRENETDAQKKSHSLSSVTGPLARVALQLDRQNKEMSGALSKTKMQFNMSEATRMPLVQALKEAKEKIEYMGKENDVLVGDYRKAREDRMEAVGIAEGAQYESNELRKEVAKLAMLPVKVSELTRRVAKNDSITQSSTVSLESLRKKYEILKTEKHKLYSEYNQVEEALMRSRAAQASAEKKLNHALDSKALAVEERIRAEQRAHLASTERNTVENLYTMAENSLSTVREKLVTLEQSDKAKSAQIRTLEEQVSHSSAIAREYEASYKAYKEELDGVKTERDEMKRELSFLTRSSSERRTEIAKIERGYKNQIIEAQTQAEIHAERCEKALQEASTAKRNLEKLQKETEKREEAWNRDQVKLSRELQEAHDSLKLYQKNSKDLLAERIEKWRVKEEELTEEINTLQTDLKNTKISENDLKNALADVQERLTITEEEYSKQIEHEITVRSKAEGDLADLNVRFQEQMEKAAELASTFKEFREEFEKTVQELEKTTKEKNDLINANANLQDMKAQLEDALTIETEAHHESRDQLEGEVVEVREHLEQANKLMADAETALLQLSLGVDLQSICPAGVTPVAYSQRMVDELRTPIETPPSRHGSIDEVRAAAASRLSSSLSRPTTSEPQIMVINEDRNDDFSLPPIGRSRVTPNPTTAVLNASMPARPATSQPRSRSPIKEERDRPRPKSTQSLLSVMKSNLLDNLSQRITQASQSAGRPLSELKSEKARIQIQNMLKHKTTLFKSKLKEVNPEDYKTIDVQDMRWVEAMHQKGMSVLEFQLAKDGHYFATIPDEAGFWRFTADRKMHVSGIKIGFPGLVIPPLGPNTYEEKFGQQQLSKKRQDAADMSKELKSTKVDDWLKTHTPLRTGLGVTRASVGMGL